MLRAWNIHVWNLLLYTLRMRFTWSASWRSLARSALPWRPKTWGGADSGRLAIWSTYACQVVEVAEGTSYSAVPKTSYLEYYTLEKHKCKRYNVYKDVRGEGTKAVWSHRKLKRQESMTERLIKVAPHEGRSNGVKDHNPRAKQGPTVYIWSA